MAENHLTESAVLNAIWKLHRLSGLRSVSWDNLVTYLRQNGFNDSWQGTVEAQLDAALHSLENQGRTYQSKPGYYVPAMGVQSRSPITPLTKSPFANNWPSPSMWTPSPIPASSVPLNFHRMPFPEFVPAEFEPNYLAEMQNIQPGTAQFATPWFRNSAENPSAQSMKHSQTPTADGAYQPFFKRAMAVSSKHPSLSPPPTVTTVDTETSEGDEAQGDSGTTLSTSTGRVDSMENRNFGTLLQDTSGAGTTSGSRTSTMLTTSAMMARQNSASQTTSSSSSGTTSSEVPRQFRPFTVPASQYQRFVSKELNDPKNRQSM